MTHFRGPELTSRAPDHEGFFVTTSGHRESATNTGWRKSTRFLSVTLEVPAFTLLAPRLSPPEVRTPRPDQRLPSLV